MPSPRHTLASLVEKQLPLDKPHKLIGGDRGFKSNIVEILTEVQPASCVNTPEIEILTEETQPVFPISNELEVKNLVQEFSVNENQVIDVSIDNAGDTQITPENQEQLNDDSITTSVEINHVEHDVIDHFVAEDLVKIQPLQEDVGQLIIKDARIEETPKERKQRLKREKEEAKKS
jgi:hypothetical protein